jgi:hypothetical protein
MNMDYHCNLINNVNQKICFLQVWLRTTLDTLRNFPSNFWAELMSRWIVKQRTTRGGVLAQEPPIFPLPNMNPNQRQQELQSKYATLPAKRSSSTALVPTNKRPRHQGSSSSLRPPKEWELSKDRFAEQDQETLEWCIKYGIDLRSLASGTQKRPPLPSFVDIQRFDVLPLSLLYVQSADS